MLVFEEGGKLENPEKTLGARARTNNKLNPHMTPCPGIEPRTHWWEASTLTTAPTLLPELSECCMLTKWQHCSFLMFSKCL